MLRGSPRLRRRVRGDILLGPMFLSGFFAAVAIPAYQDFMIRSQVAEAFVLTSAIKTATAEYYVRELAWPASLKDLDFQRTPRGRYVAAVTLKQGTIVIRYGVRANARISRHRLTLRPTTDEHGDIVWSCGYANDVGVDPGSGPASPHATDIARKYLPVSCRGAVPR
jgi:type IV pilus assembly protein PilA